MRVALTYVIWEGAFDASEFSPNITVVELHDPYRHVQVTDVLELVTHEGRLGWWHMGEFVDLDGAFTDDFVKLERL